MGFFYKETICEICFNTECSSRGTRNLNWGYDPEKCISFKKSKEEASTMKKVERSEADDVDYSTHYDLTRRDN